jgi:hypothetical protein
MQVSLYFMTSSDRYGSLETSVNPVMFNVIAERSQLQNKRVDLKEEPGNLL